MVNFQCRLTTAEINTLQASAAGLSALVLKPMSAQDMFRLWIQEGCPLPSKSAAQRSPEDSEIEGAVKTPEQAKQAANLAAARSGRTPIPRPGEKKK